MREPSQNISSGIVLNHLQLPCSSWLYQQMAPRSLPLKELVCLPAIYSWCWFRNVNEQLGFWEKNNKKLVYVVLHIIELRKVALLMLYSWKQSGWKASWLTSPCLQCLSMRELIISFSQRNKNDLLDNQNHHDLIKYYHKELLGYWKCSSSALSNTVPLVTCDHWPLKMWLVQLRN